MQLAPTEPLVARAPSLLLSYRPARRYVIQTAAAGRQLKIQFDTVNVVPLPLANGGAVSGASCVARDFTYVCTNTAAAFAVTVPLRCSRSTSTRL